MTQSVDDARSVLRAIFGYPDFRAAQLPVIGSVMAGRDTLAVLPTGGGKSLCYQVPAITRGGVSLVVSPLISLMQDQVARLETLGVRAAFLNSTLDASNASRLLRAAVHGEITLLYVAPERFQSESFMTAMRDTRIALMAVDEAHCISEWGHEFRPGFRRIGEARRTLGSPQLVALTATATPTVRADILRQLGIPGADVHVAGFDRPNLTYAVQPCADDAAKQRALVDALRRHGSPAVVYASTRGSVEIVAGRLARAGMRAAAYHAGLPDARRHGVQDDFMSGRVPVIVATNAFGMGIDKPDVRLVAHYTMPGTLEAYYQEGGRAGRDGEPSRCVLLYTASDRATHEHFIDHAHPARAVVERVHAAIVEYARNARVPSEDVIHAGSRLSTDQVQSAIALLLRHRVLCADREDDPAMLVRVLATPTRIGRELTAPAHAGERRLMRELCARRPGDAYAAFEVSLRGLGVGSPRTTQALLDGLRARQFVDARPLDSGLRIARPDRPLETQIDWAALARRRAHELSKLDSMEAYARARICRRAFVLRYFGDPRTPARCAGCDNCLGTGLRAPSSPRRS